MEVSIIQKNIPGGSQGVFHLKSQLISGKNEELTFGKNSQIMR
jgi:hypothetical protein